jgi:hypothetical protein
VRRVLTNVALRYSASQAGVQLALVNTKSDARAADSAPGLPLTRLRYSAAHMGCTIGGVADLESVRGGGVALSPGIDAGIDAPLERYALR